MSRLAVLAASALLAACATAGPRLTFLPAGDQLTSCPPAPHCVSSRDTDARHHVEPLRVRPGAADAWARLVRTVAATERTTIVVSNERYLHAEVVSPWHFYTDDLELLLDPASGRVDVRSASRIGYYDFGVNRNRVEALRRRLIESGVLVPEGYP